MSKDLKKQRPLSAQPVASYTQRRNEWAENAKNYYEREQLIKKVYIRTKSANPNRPLSAIKLSQAPIETEKPKKIIKTKPREQMADEIVRLKLKINGLNQDLSHQRGKTQEIRKKYNKFAKVLNVEFENQRVWNAGIINTHKVQGIRSMYDRLKEQHQTIRIHYISLLKSSKITHEMQNQHYIEALESEIRNLYQRFQRIEQNIVNLLADTKKDGEVNGKMFLLGGAEQQCNRLEERHKKMKAKLQMNTQLLKDRQKKIVFLDRYAKQQENKLQKSQKHRLSLEKELQFIKNKLEVSLEEKQRILFKTQKQINQLFQMVEFNKLRFQEERSTLIQERDLKLANLQQQNRYYLNTINQLRKSNNQMAQQYEKIKNSSVVDLGSFKLKADSTIIPQQKQKATRLAKEENKTVEKEYVSKESQSTVDKNVMKTADKPRNQYSAKKRRVQHTQVIQISALMKYRLIGKNIPFDKVKTLFLHGRNQKNQHEYINMKETKQILLSEPFALPEKQADIMARYLIQDVKQQYVYVDQENQNYREIVKSILKTLLGQYPLVATNEQLQEEIKRFHKQYATNLRAILKGVSSSGIISKRKFLEVFKGVGVEFSQDFIDVMLGKMAKTAQNINAFHYEQIFIEEDSF